MKKKTVQVIYEIEKKTNIYRKIPKISPSMYKPPPPPPQTGNANNPSLNISPPPLQGGLYLKNVPQIQSKTMQKR